MEVLRGHSGWARSSHLQPLNSPLTGRSSCLFQRPHGCLKTGSPRDMSWASSHRQGSTTQVSEAEGKLPAGCLSWKRVLGSFMVLTIRLASRQPHGDHFQEQSEWRELGNSHDEAFMLKSPMDICVESSTSCCQLPLVDNSECDLETNLKQVYKMKILGKVICAICFYWNDFDTFSVHLPVLGDIPCFRAEFWPTAERLFLRLELTTFTFSIPADLSALWSLQNILMELEGAPRLLLSGSEGPGKTSPAGGPSWSSRRGCSEGPASCWGLGNTQASSAAGSAGEVHQWC